METNSAKSILKHFLIEFLMIFLGVFLAFWINDWAERKRNQKYTANIFKNITDDIRSDSVRIHEALQMLERQHTSLSKLTTHLRDAEYDSANFYLRSCYISYNAFQPTTESYQSMMYGGDFKLIDDYHQLKIIKEIDQMNQKLIKVHELYYSAVEDIRNGFICKHDMQKFDFRAVENKIELWNRVNFLQGTYIRNYQITLAAAQEKYNKFLLASQQ